MAYRRAEARIIEALLACLLLTLTLYFTNPYFLNQSLVSLNENKNELASRILAYLAYNNILRQAYYKNYSIIVDSLEQLVAPEYSFKIAFYDENWSLIWSYSRANFNEAKADSAIFIMNGTDGLAYDYIIIVVLAVS